jgi:molybdopterin converting factor small subunit
MQTLTGGDRTATVPGATLREVIDNLDARYPGIKNRLLDENGRLQPDIAAAIDGETEHFGLIEPVRENSEIHFIPAISGGSEPARSDLIGAKAAGS